ncbi:Rpn family recombination-promoting nuclease/putative transposase [Veillonella magna]|uniref:Rpn family recombination-promoting nuclease/putative transposase n=1 Tax=Veillonella magna TaxID=464322 RepID=UPI0023F2BE11|nr:Rpn family recombination-promoting nuclease/putative transposase [Veillonella magna]MBD8975141.1 Rpn family recombination-promoting nuclease/putative transposase [Veillonella magna]
MITKQTGSSIGSTIKDMLDEKINSNTIMDNNPGVATNTRTTFLYSRPTQSLLVHEDVIDYETQLALREKWKNLTITDNFLFEKVMRNKRICKRLIEKILGMTIADINFPESEKVIDMRRDSKGVRLDVYVTDMDGNIYDIEMQCTNEGPEALGGRTRYYQSMIDADTFSKGSDYRNLRTTYIIFICTFDFLGHGEPLYECKTCWTKKSRDIIQDKSTKIFLNSTVGTADATPDQYPEVDKDLFYLLQYIHTHVVHGDFVKEIDEELTNIKFSETQEVAYMTYEMELLVRHNDGIREGIAIGREEGLNQGLKQGQAVGRKFQAQKMALSMLEDKASIALISKYTGLSEQEILDLAKEHNLL